MLKEIFILKLSFRSERKPDILIIREKDRTSFIAINVIFQFYDFFAFSKRKTYLIFRL